MLLPYHHCDRAPDPSDADRGGQSISLQAALYGAITSNPDLVTLRQGNALAASAEAVEVARHFPTTLNPTLWMDYRPITLVPNGTFGTSSPAGRAAGKSGFYHYGQDYIYISLAPTDRAGPSDHPPLSHRRGRVTTSRNGSSFKPS